MNIRKTFGEMQSICEDASHLTRTIAPDMECDADSSALSFDRRSSFSFMSASESAAYGGINSGGWCMVHEYTVVDGVWCMNIQCAVYSV
jgi:hypothetical protein